MNAIILGSNSDIAQGILQMLEKDYVVQGWHRGQKVEWQEWDLVIITLGMVAPVGLWHDVNEVHWAECIYSNLTRPFQLLRSLWSKRNHNATVIWFSGSNPNKIMDGYSSYNVAKMAVNKLIEQLDHESPDCKFIAFAPGYVRDSKIHKATLEANWPNERIARGDAGNSMEDIYKAMKWCVEQSKELVGGRNVCVSDNLLDFWHHTSEFGKLRRVEK